MELINKENNRLIYKDDQEDVYYTFIKYENKYMLKTIINKKDNFVIDSEIYSYCNSIMWGEYSQITIYLENDKRTINFNNNMVITDDQIEVNDIIYTFNGSNYINGNNIYNGKLINDYYLYYFLDRRELSKNISDDDKLVKIKKCKV